MKIKMTKHTKGVKLNFEIIFVQKCEPKFSQKYEPKFSLVDELITIKIAIFHSESKLDRFAR